MSEDDYIAELRRASGAPCPKAFWRDLLEALGLVAVIAIACGGALYITMR